MSAYLVILWLHRAAITLLVAFGAAMAFCILAGAIIAVRAAAGWTPELLAAIFALAALFGWAGGAFLLALLAWTGLSAMLPGPRP